MAYPSILELFIESIFKFIFGKDNLKIKNYADFKKKKHQLNSTSARLKLGEKYLNTKSNHRHLLLLKHKWFQ